MTLTIRKLNQHVNIYRLHTC